MTNSDGLLRARWRRLNARLKEVRSSVGSGDQDRLPDAVSGALDAMNEMWVYWCGKKTLGTLKDQDNFVRGDVEGETAAALVHARGAKTHDPEEFGDLTDTYTDVYSDLYGVWRWQAYSRPDPKYKNRDQWYGQHVADKEILSPFDAAVRWMHRQPEL